MLTSPAHESVLDLIGNTPWSTSRCCRRIRMSHPRQAGEPEPVRVGEGPHRQVHDRRCREARSPASRPDDRRGVVGQHRDRPRRHRPSEGLPDQGPAPPTRRSSGNARCSAQIILPREGGSTAPSVEPSNSPPSNPSGASSTSTPMTPTRGRTTKGPDPEIWRTARRSALRRRSGHQWDAHGDRPLPQGAQPGRQDRRHRAAPGRACRGPAGLADGYIPVFDDWNGSELLDRKRVVRPRESIE